MFGADGQKSGLHVHLDAIPLPLVVAVAVVVATVTIVVLVVITVVVAGSLPLQVRFDLRRCDHFFGRLVDLRDHSEGRKGRRVAVRRRVTVAARRLNLAALVRLGRLA